MYTSNSMLLLSEIHGLFFLHWISSKSVLNIPLFVPKISGKLDFPHSNGLIDARLWKEVWINICTCLCLMEIAPYLLREVSMLGKYYLKTGLLKLAVKAPQMVSQIR